MSDLIERLRSIRGNFIIPIESIPLFQWVEEAADALEAKGAEIERLHGEVTGHSKYIAKQDRRIAKLQAVVDYVRTIDHLQANEYLHELIAALNTGGEGNE